MKKIFILLVFFGFYNQLFANTFIEQKIDWYNFRVIKYDINSKLYDFKVAISNSGDTLNQILKDNNWISWINWAFFCPKDYSMCKDRPNTTNNERYVKWEKFWISYDTWNRVVFAIDKDNIPFLFQSYLINKDREEDIYYWLSNWPLLLQDWIPQTEKYWELGLIDNKMKVFWRRNFICSDELNKNIYFWFVDFVDIDTLAVVLKKFWCHNAINLDAWLSSAMIYNWRYLIWPWRDIIESVFISPKNLNLDKLDKSVKKVLINILKSIQKYDLDKKILALEKIDNDIIKYRKQFYNLNSVELFEEKDWELIKNWYEINIDTNNKLVQIYVINNLWEYINEMIKIMYKIKNLDLSNSFNFKLTPNLFFNFD